VLSGRRHDGEMLGVGRWLGEVLDGRLGRRSNDPT